MNQRTSKITILLATGVLVGLIATKQFLLTPKFQQITDQDRSQMIALETAEFYQANLKLQEEIEQLAVQKNQLSEKSSTGQSEEALKTVIEQLTIVTGQKPIIGPGVVLILQDQLSLTDLVDIVNALRNIGAEGIAINQTRLIAESGLTNDELRTNATVKKLSYPLKVEVIGSSDVLADALTRKGGVLSQINGRFKVEKNSTIELPAYH